MSFSQMTPSNVSSERSPSAAYQQDPFNMSTSSGAGSQTLTQCTKSRQVVENEHRVSMYRARIEKLEDHLVRERARADSLERHVNGLRTKAPEPSSSEGIQPERYVTEGTITDNLEAEKTQKYIKALEDYGKRQVKELEKMKQAYKKLESKFEQELDETCEELEQCRSENEDLAMRLTTMSGFLAPANMPVYLAEFARLQAEADKKRHRMMRTTQARYQSHPISQKALPSTT